MTCELITDAWKNEGSQDHFSLEQKVAKILPAKLPLVKVAGDYAAQSEEVSQTVT